MDAEAAVWRDRSAAQAQADAELARRVSAVRPSASGLGMFFAIPGVGDAHAGPNRSASGSPEKLVRFRLLASASMFAPFGGGCFVSASPDVCLVRSSLGCYECM